MKTHCARGHEMTPDNTSVDGRRRCKTCARVETRIRRENMTAEKRAAAAKKKAEYFKLNYTTGRMVGTVRKADVIASRPTDELIAEARRRASAPHRDLAAMFFGDPPKGWSALDQRQSV